MLVLTRKPRQQIMIGDHIVVNVVEVQGKERNIEISALAFYPNMLDHDPEKRAASVEHLHKVIDAAALLNVNMVTTFIGRDQTKNIDDNLKLVREIWPEIV